ncbi:hypothetical protein RhiirC2_781318 [Rhizophagus irregularis]|uniref:Uncharacterized protein n=1 Tax=Rhizophagus irregularis TaxID=588596 RepID=A0A2N1N5Q2_9GLOM|nr:hypothetical protein RhiirC2_781318 [Rhizophagus irregularis]
MVGKEIATQIMSILKKNKFTSPFEIIATIEAMILKINGEIVELFDRACDETCDSYRRLAKAVPNLIREHNQQDIGGMELTMMMMWAMYCLYIGKESYNSLSIVSAKFSQELEQLKTNGYKDSNNTIWPIELFFSGD